MNKNPNDFNVRVISSEDGFLIHETDDGGEHKSADWRSKNLGYGSKGEMIYIK